MRVSYSGNTPVFQTGVGGSIPPTRLSNLKYPSSDGYFKLDQTVLKEESKGISKRECLHVLKTRALEEREAPAIGGVRNAGEEDSPYPLSCKNTVNLVFLF